MAERWLGMRGQRSSVHERGRTGHWAHKGENTGVLQQPTDKLFRCVCTPHTSALIIPFLVFIPPVIRYSVTFDICQKVRPGRGFFLLLVLFCFVFVKPTLHASKGLFTWQQEKKLIEGGSVTRREAARKEKKRKRKPLIEVFSWLGDIIAVKPLWSPLGLIPLGD